MILTLSLKLPKRLGKVGKEGKAGKGRRKTALLAGFPSSLRLAGRSDGGGAYGASGCDQGSKLQLA
jgi:hypothetical protein